MMLSGLHNLYFCFGLHPRSAQLSSTELSSTELSSTQLLLRRKVETERHSLASPASVACLNKTPLCRTASQSRSDTRQRGAGLQLGAGLQVLSV